MSNDFEYIATFLVGVIITAWVFAVIFRIGRQRKLLQVQCGLLIKMAEKAGVSPDEVDKVIKGVYQVQDIPPFLKRSKKH